MGALKGERAAAEFDSDRPSESRTNVEPDSSPFPTTAQAKRRAQRAAGIACLVLLMERFPAAFAPFGARTRKALKVGIDRDIAAAMPELMAGELSVALRIYTGSLSYLHAMTDGAIRVGVAGQPAGVVTAEAAAIARERLAKDKRPSPPAATSPAPAQAKKRLTFADLRAAAARRKIEAAP